MSAQQPSNSSTSQQSSHSPFQVVPPHLIESSASTQANNTIEFPTPSSNDKKSPKSYSHLILGGVILGGLAISFIPTPYQVGGDTKLDWPETARQSIYTPIPAVVEQVLVKLGDQVQVGQPLIKLSSRELEREIASVQEKLVQSKQALEQSQQEQVKARAALIQTIAQAQAVRNQANHALNRMNQLEQNVIPPEIQQLQIERQRLQEQLQEITTEVERFKGLYRNGAISLSQVEKQESTYRNVKRDLDINAERLELARRQIQEEATRELGNINYQAASVTASQMIVKENRQMTAHQQAITILKNRLQQLQAQQNALTIVASTTGRVVTNDLDLLIGREVRPENVLLQVAEARQLIGNVEIKEEDRDFVKLGASVTFRPRQAKLETYNARVETILPNVEVDVTQQKRVLTVRIVIDNPQERLSRGSSGYAKIFSEWIPLYQRLGREIMKLVPERFL